MTAFLFQLRKELRLLWPATLIALLCLFLPTGSWERHWQILIVLCGLVLLAVRGFGTEFHHGTFSLYFAQPAPRNRLWLLKAFALALSMGGLISIWHLVTSNEYGNALLPMGWALEDHGMIVWAVGVVLAGGGLFFSLLFRQAAAALWATLIFPGGLAFLLLGLLSIQYPDLGEELFKMLSIPAAFCYGIALAVASWILFRRMEDREILSAAMEPSFASLRLVKMNGRSATWSLLAKELRLQQVNILLALSLIVFHLIGYVLRKWVLPAGSPYADVLGFMPWLLLVILPPLLIGCAAVAEERRMGTILWHRTLPISLFRQWLLKLAVTFGLIFVLTWVLPIVLRMNITEVNFKTRVGFLVVSCSLALAGLLVSSLNRTVLGAFGSAVALSAGVCVALFSVDEFLRKLSLKFYGIYTLSGGMLNTVILITGVAMAVAALVLVFRNMKRVSIVRRDVLTSALILLGTTLAGLALSGAIIFRTWEVFMSVPQPGPEVRLVGPIEPKIQGSFGSSYVLLPDGRLYHLFYETGLKQNTARVQLGQGDLWKDVSDKGPKWSTLGVREDGTLWSWGVIYFAKSVKDLKASADVIQPPQQIGSDTNWLKVFGAGDSAFALKTDGSLWAWGKNSQGQLGIGSTEEQALPVRVGTDDDWVDVCNIRTGHSMALKRDGSLWHWGKLVNKGGKSLVPTAVALGNEWAEIESPGWYMVGVKRNGTLWWIEPLNYRADQVGNASDWKAFGPAGAIKKDGSLWELPLVWNTRFNHGGERKISQSTNWIATGQFASLAADGSFIVKPSAEAHESFFKGFALAPSRIPPFAINLAQEIKP